MKNKFLPFAFNLILLSLLFSSCSAITGIFKAGMGVGAFIVVAVIVLLIILVMRSKKK